ncbi:PIR Superfamily Protein [Plasmodium malariae]|uniref:PIR Superfamily Protein n=1 Tax=Plasmodium malariae TaxID=5858 RepID=A0A1A8WP88_PLAMA|nr:PIR Superfamily Protein [Plasmodium malariae]
MEKTDYDEVLQQLPLYKIYNEFNSEVREVDYNISCDKFDSVKEKYKNDCVNLCKKVARNLNNLTKADKSWSYDSRCSHYKYWIYEEITKLFKEDPMDKDVEDVVKSFFNLQSVLTATYGIYSCKNDFIQKNISELKDKIEEKYLHDYFTNYKMIKSKNVCNKVKMNKYKKYINYIYSIYQKKKNKCCKPGVLTCPHYFFNCNDEFNPNMLLSELKLENVESCNGLEDFKENKIIENKVDSSGSEPDIFDSILFTDCPFSDNSTTVRCGFIRASSMRTSNGNTVENHEQQKNAESSFSEIRMIKSNTYSSEDLSEKNNMKFSDSSTMEKNKMLFDGSTVDGFRWNYGSGGLSCIPNTSEEDEYGLCEYMDELVADGIFIKTMDSNGYKFKKVDPWTNEELQKLVRRKRDRRPRKSVLLKLIRSRSLHAIRSEQAPDSVIKSSHSEKHLGLDSESNILHNTFVRISFVATLIMGIILIFFLYFKFTSFGSYAAKIKKRKKKYRTNFAELNTQRLSRRFIKRTYRHSSKRRFSVVNI